MATVKLGAIITEIAGSIGGWTFRRNRGVTMVFSKINGASKNKLLLNRKLGALRGIIQGWALLTQGLRDDWVAAAPLFLFPDKFGDMRALSGRALYIKLTAQLSITEDASPNPTTLDSSIGDNNFDSAVIVALGVKTVTMNHAEAGIDYLIQVEKLRNESISPTFNRREIIANQTTTISTTLDYTTEFAAKFGVPQPFTIFNVYVTPQNADGFRGATQVIKVTTSG